MDLGTPPRPLRSRSARARRPRALAAAAVAAALAVGGLAGCSSDGSDGATTTTVREAGSPLSSADAARLARVLFRNTQAGGATVTASAEYSDQVTVQLTGTIDFAAHTGRLTVTSTTGGSAPVEEELVFEEDAVYDRPTAEVAARLQAAGRTDVAWVRRAPDTAQRPVDQVIALLVSLSSTRPDNPELLEQQELSYDRTEEVDGEAADVFTSSAAAASYWVAVDGDRLLRFQGVLAGFAGPLVVDLTDLGPVEVEVPSGPTVVDAADLPAA